jgi:hypothetical protein
MSKSERKLRRRHRFAVLPGGGQPKPPDTEAARYARAVDRFTRDYVEQHPELKQSDVVATLLQLAAGAGVEMGASIDDIQGAAGVFYDREYEARKGKPRV